MKPWWRLFIILKILFWNNIPQFFSPLWPYDVILTPKQRFWAFWGLGFIPCVPFPEKGTKEHRKIVCDTIFEEHDTIQKYSTAASRKDTEAPISGSSLRLHWIYWCNFVRNDLSWKAIWTMRVDLIRILFCIEVGARGYCANNSSWCQKKLGFFNKQACDTAKSLGLTAMKASFALWLARSDKSKVIEEVQHPKNIDKMRYLYLRVLGHLYPHLAFLLGLKRPPSDSCCPA